MSFAYKFSKYNRGRKWDMFMDYFKPDDSKKILDVGFNEKEYNDVQNYIEKHYPYLNRITALGIETGENFKKRYPEVEVVTYDGTIFPFGEKQFDICWSNAVLEHVGNKERQVLFVREVNKVSKAAFLTTPNRFFPIEVHTRIPFLHWLPKNIFDKILVLLGKEGHTGDYMHLLSHRQLKRILKEAGVQNYKIKRNRLLGFTLDFVVILPYEAN